MEKKQINGRKIYSFPHDIQLNVGKTVNLTFFLECGKGEDERQVLADGLLQENGRYPVSRFTIFSYANYIKADFFLI